MEIIFTSGRKKTVKTHFDIFTVYLITRYLKLSILPTRIHQYQVDAHPA